MTSGAVASLAWQIAERESADVAAALPFADLASATRGVTRFVDWYNGAHRHSAIRYVTPDQRHHSRERAVLASRHDLYECMRRANPERWSGRIRNWLPVGSVVLKPRTRITRDNYLDAHRRNRLLPLSRQGQTVASSYL